MHDDGCPIAADPRNECCGCEKKIGHTPGPWSAYNAHNGRVYKYWRVNSRYGLLATIDNMRALSGDEEVANAHLIASAPDLLDACSSAISAIQDLYHKLPDEADKERLLSYADKIGLAVKKAKGVIS